MPRLGEKKAPTLPRGSFGNPFRVATPRPGSESCVDDYKVMDLMVPLSEYATVPESASLYEAILALEKAQAEFDHTKIRHRAVLVLDRDRKVIGKLSQLDVLRALESSTNPATDLSAEIGDCGFSPKIIRRVQQQNRGPVPSLTDLCSRVGRLDAKVFMQRPTEGEFVDGTANVVTAIHQLVTGNHLSLLVTDAQDRILGILRLTDVFAALFHMMKECETEAKRIAS